MRLRERDKRDVTLRACTGFDDDVYLWGDATPISAAIYPNRRGIDAKVYGEKIEETRLLLYDGDVRLAVGMGVSESEGAPMWRIKSLEDWGHQSAVLEWIPEARRGA